MQQETAAATMGNRESTRAPRTGKRTAAWLLGGIGVVVAGAMLALPWLWPTPRASGPEGPKRVKARLEAELVAGQPDALRLPADVAERLGIVTAAVAPSTHPRVLDLSGSLALDANYLARVHSRFPGEVMQIKEVPDNRPGETGGVRPLRAGDQVKRGDALAVVWSKDLGEKKSDLMDALSQLRLDRETLQRAQEVYQKGALPERSLREAERTVQAREIAAAKIERTLRSWRLTDEEIDAIRAEVDPSRPQKEKEIKKQERDWAKLEVRSPLDGTILEKNVVVGDIVDPITDLFKVADLHRLSVWANVYEEDLPELLRLPADRLRWTIRLKSEPEAAPLVGPIDHIGDIIDPNQHTAIVMGRVDNPRARLRAGQFILATIELPPSGQEVVVPVGALIEDGREHVVFVQPDPAKPEYVLRRVAIHRRLNDAVCLRGQLRPEEQGKGLTVLQPGERVVTDGAVELKAALENLKNTK